MYDNLDLSRSRAYFALLQHLRIYRLEIENTMKHVAQCCKGNEVNLRFDLQTSWQGTHLQIDKLLQYWRAKADIMNDELELLLDRIRQKEEEIVTLRDGVGFVSAHVVAACC